MKFNSLQIYYFTTPIFFILYYYFDINLRISIPGAEDYWIYLYYLICFIASFFIFKNIIAGALFALVESSINILFLLMSVFIPIVNIGKNTTNINPVNFGTAELLHFFITGAILLYSFHSNPLFNNKR